MKNVVLCILAFVMLCPVAFAGHGHNQSLRERFRDNQRQRQRQRLNDHHRDVERVVVRQRVIVDDHRGHRHNQRVVERIVVPQRVTRYAEVKDLEFLEDSYGERIVVKEKVVAPQRVRVVERVEVEGHDECVIEVERLRGSY